jgi:cell division protein FtsZ
MQGAKSIVVNITGGPDLSLAEASEATGFITRVADPEANVIYGIVTNEKLHKAVKVTVIATGFQREAEGEASKRLGPLAADGRARPNGKAEPETEKRGVGGFVRRMWGARAAKQ